MKFSILNFRFSLCLAALTGVFVSLPARAQDTTPDGSFVPDGASETMRFMVSNALAQFGEVMSTNVFGTNETDQADYSNGGTNGVADTNLTSEAESQDRSLRHESRSQWLDRQRARQASAAASAQARETGQSSAAAQRDNAPARPDYSNFSLVYERNIFDPNRVPSRPSRNRTRELPNRVESFSLVGTMSYEKGTFAFFDGTSSDYKKALKLSDSIAGYKVTNITPDAVKLASGTNQVELRVGMQMRSEDGGEWQRSTQAQSYAETSAASTSVVSTSSSPASNPAPLPSGADSDVVRRMLERRAQE
jgi:hypothetical protein